MYTVSRTDLAFKAKARWARYIRDQTEKVNRIQADFGRLERDYRIGAQRLEALESAYRAVSKAQRVQVEIASTANVVLEQGKIRVQKTYTLAQFKGLLRSLCAAVSRVVSSFSTGNVRCGLVVRKAKRFLPIVVFDPRVRGYCSSRIYEEKHFSGQVLKRFEDFKRPPHYKTHNVFASRENGDFVTLILMDQDQEPYLKDIIGNVIYFRKDVTEAEPLGVLNIDCDIERGLPLKDFRSIQKYLLPIYRQLAAMLYVLRQVPDLYDEMRQLDETKEMTLEP